MKLPRVVVALGLVSLFTDIASEMVYPLLPTLLAGLGAGAVSLGAVEGVGDATAAVVKLFSGRLSSKVTRRMPLVLAGYGLSAVVRPFVAVVIAPWQVVLLRFVDRVGKGVRTSPRDALLAQSVPRERAGAAFGFHRAMDNVGATVGPLLVALALRFTSDIHQILTASLVPGLLALAVILVGVRDEPAAPAKSGAAPGESTAPPSVDRAPSALLGYLGILGFFYVINTSDLFLLRRLSELGATPSSLALAWALLSGVRALSGYPGGVLSDRIGRSRSMMLGWLLYAASYGAMAFATSLGGFALALVAYGLFYGFTEGAERAMVASLAPRDVLGGAFGRFHLVTGLASLPSNLAFGWAWDRVGGPRCLLLSAAGALVALALLSAWTGRFMPRLARATPGP